MSANEVKLTNTILDNSGNYSDCGGNIQYPGASCGQSILSVNPLLGPLANNGGLAQTYALQPGSPAINYGDNAACSAKPVNGKD